MKIRLIVVGIVIIFFASCSKETKNLEQLNWLIGEWGNISEEREFYEIWYFENDSSFYGESYLTVKEDTVFHETMTLEFRMNEIILTPTTKNQNDGKPVEFKLTSEVGREFIFENPKHDFPQRIVYSNPAPDSIVAYIDGKVSGEYNRSDFIFVRKNKIH